MKDYTIGIIWGKSAGGREFENGEREITESTELYHKTEGKHLKSYFFFETITQREAETETDFCLS